MLFLYRIAIRTYGFLVWLLSFSNSKANKFLKGRKDWKSRLSSDLKANDLPLIWIHVASLGEFEQGRPIIEGIRKQNINARILLTFFSPSGYEVRKKYDQVDWIHYLPLDTPSNAKEFVGLVKPSLVIFIKYEFWYYLLRETIRYETPILMVSSIFRKNQLFFHWSGSFFKSIFKNVAHFFVQDDLSKELISTISERVTVAGDTRFDRVIEIAGQADRYEVIDQFVGEEDCFIIGSSWPSDFKLLLPFIKENMSEVKFIIAPHNITPEEIQSILSELSSACAFSKPENLDSMRVLIIDNIGMLASLYRYGNYAYIGGGTRGALHNTLEAAVFGMPIFFGAHENNKKFNEAIELTEEGAAFPITDTKQLSEKFVALSSNKELYDQVSSSSKDYVLRKSGATELILEKIKGLI